MNENLEKFILKSISSTKDLRNKLIIIVGEKGSGKTPLLKKISKKVNSVQINLNLEASKRLLDMTQRQRKLNVQSVLLEILKIGEKSDCILLDNTEILFDSTLKQNPVSLLKEVSRHKCVIASWRGNLTNNRLNYAEHGHPEYQSHAKENLIIIDLNNKNQHEGGQI